MQENKEMFNENIFFRRIAVAMASILLCMAAMGFTAYAYFSSSITSSSNTITAAAYSTEITVVDEASNEVTPTVNQVVQTYTLGEGTYTVTIEALGNVITGYSKIVIGDVNSELSMKYFTIPMSPDTQSANNQLTFTIECYESSAQVHFITNWGSTSETNADNIVEQGESILIGNSTSKSGESS